MKRYWADFKGAKSYIIGIIIFGIATSIFSKDKDIKSILELWGMSFAMFTFVAIDGLYYNHIRIYPDQTLKMIGAWIFHKPRVHPKQITAVGLLPNFYKKLYVEYKNKNGEIRQFSLGIQSVSQFAQGEILNHIYTINPEVNFDDYTQELIGQYRNHPEKMEKSWQEKTNRKWPLSRQLTDAIMFIAAISCIALFIYIAFVINPYGWQW